MSSTTPVVQVALQSSGIFFNTSQNLVHPVLVCVLDWEGTRTLKVA